MPNRAALLLAILLLPLAAAPAAAQDPADCLGRLDAPPCAAPWLRAADARLRAARREATASTVRPATLAAEEAAWRDRLRAGQPASADRARPYDRDQVVEMARHRTEELRELTRQDRAIGAVRYGPSCANPSAGCAETRGGPLNTLSLGCLGTALRNCTRREVGSLWTESHPVALLWQTQAGHTDRAGVRGGVVIVERAADGWRPLVWAYEAGEYGTPRLIERDGMRLLTVPGRRVGSGGHDADLLLVQEGGRWREVEILSWRAELDRRLPEGLGAWQGVEYDFAAMTARTRLWRPDDANCCPRGGSAVASLRIEGDSLRLTGLSVERALPP